MDEARALYEWFLPLLRLDTVPKFVQLIKLVQTEIGQGNAVVRPPRLELEGRELSDVLAVIRAQLATRPVVKEAPPTPRRELLLQWDVKAAGTSYERIYAAVRRIPHGRVTTYGAIARIAGLPDQARLVGTRSATCPTEQQCPGTGDQRAGSPQSRAVWFTVGPHAANTTATRGRDC